MVSFPEPTEEAVSGLSVTVIILTIMLILIVGIVRAGSQKPWGIHFQFVCN